MTDEKQQDEPKTVTRVDAFGNEIEVPVGADGENPVSPNNPPAKALPEGYRDMTPDEAAEARQEETQATQGEDTSAASSGGGEEPSAGGKPADSDAKQAWVDYAVSQGMSADEANSHTKAELIETYKDV